MAATFNPSLVTEVDWIRFLSKDTNVAAARLQDETLSALLASEGNRYLAAAMALELGAMSVDHSTLKDKMVGDLRVIYGGKSSDEVIGNYATYLRKRGALAATPRPQIFEVI